MKNLKYLLFLMVAVSLSFVACTEKDGDDDDDGITEVKVDMLVTKVTNATDGSYKEYLYNADNTLKQVLNKDAAEVELPYYDDYSYTNGKLATYISYANSAPSTKIIATYDGDKPKIFKKQSDQGAGLVDDYDIYFTFAGDNLTKLEYKKDIGTGLVVLVEATYTYSGTKVSKVALKIYDGSALADNDVTEYSYDSKKNPFMGIGLDYFMGYIVNTVPNNMTMTQITSAAGQLNEALSNNVTYQYNFSDYPTKSTTISFDTNNEKVLTYEYKEK